MTAVAEPPLPQGRRVRRPTPAPRFDAPTFTLVEKAPLLRPGWIVPCLFAAFPVWWAMGLGGFIWALIAIPLAASLVMRKTPIMLPKGFGVWLIFMFWMFISASQLDSGDRLIGFALRAAGYVAVSLLMIYVFNGAKSLPTERVAKALIVLWIASIVGGLAGLIVPDIGWTTPVALVMPASLKANAYITDLITPGLADIHNFLGYAAPRPKAPFTYTNGWGAAVALLTPLAIAGLAVPRIGVSRRTIRILLALSVIPIVLSLNRGLWLSLSLGLAYAAVRLTARGQVRALAILLLVAGAVVVALFTTSLGDVAASRLETGHSDEGRSSLYAETLDRTSESPALGFGAPRPSQIIESGPSVGTHGLIWLVIFSHGFVGAGLFLTFFIGLVWRTRSPATMLGFWCHVVVVIGLFELVFYGMLPAPLFIVFTAAMIALRETRHGRQVSARSAWTPTESEELPSAAVGASAARVRREAAFRSGVRRRINTSDAPQPTRTSGRTTTLAARKAEPAPPVAAVPKEEIAMPPKPMPTFVMPGANESADGSDRVADPPPEAPKRTMPLDRPDDADELAWLASMLWTPAADVTLTPAAGDGPKLMSWLATPSARHPHTLVPTEPKLAAVAASRFHDGMSRTARLRSAVAPRVLRMGAGAIINRATVHAISGSGSHDRSTSLIAYLEHVLVEPELQVAVTLGPPKANRKPVLQLLRPDSSVVGFAKVGWDEATMRLVDNEADILEQLARVHTVGFSVPLPLHHSHWNGLSLLVVSPLSMRLKRDRSPRTPPPLEVGGSIARCLGTTTMALGASPDLTRRMSSPDPDVANAATQIWSSWPTEQIEFGAWHGDYSPWNMSTSNGHVRILDWEFAATGVPVGFDVIHFHTQIEMIAKSRDAGSSLAEAEKQGLAAVRNLGVPEGAIRPIWACYLLEMAERAGQLIRSGEPERLVDLRATALELLTQEPKA